MPGTAASARAVGDRRNNGQAAHIKQHLAQTPAIVEVHIHKFKGHSLRASSAHQRLRFDVAHTLREFQVDERARREMAFAFT